MAEIILTEEQTRLLARTFGGPVAVRDAKGNLLEKFDAQLTPDMIAELKRRAASPGPWFTGEQVHARLVALQEEWDRTGGFDQTYMFEFLARLDQADPGHMRTEE